MSAPIVEVEVLTGGVDFFTSEPLDIGRVQFADGRVWLAKQEPPGSPWVATWIGDRTKAPVGFVLGDDVVSALDSAPRVPVDEWCRKEASA